MTDELSRHLVERWRGGDEKAAEELFERYLSQLVGLARSRMSAKLSQRVDAEDVVQSVFRSFFVAARAGRYKLHQGGDLWRLLVAITLHKLRDQAKYNGSAKRDARRERRPNDLTELIAAREPTPLEAVTLEEQVETLMSDLTPLDRQVVEMRLQGHDRGSIAEATGRSVRTVNRVLDRIKQNLEQACESPGGH